MGMLHMILSCSVSTHSLVGLKKCIACIKNIIVICESYQIKMNNSHYSTLIPVDWPVNWQLHLSHQLLLHHIRPAHQLHWCCQCTNPSVSLMLRSFLTRERDTKIFKFLDLRQDLSLQPGEDKPPFSMASDLKVLIFIPAASHLATNRPSKCLSSPRTSVREKNWWQSAALLVHHILETGLTYCQQWQTNRQPLTEGPKPPTPGAPPTGCHFGHSRTTSPSPQSTNGLVISLWPWDAKWFARISSRLTDSPPQDQERNCVL